MLEAQQIWRVYLCVALAAVSSVPAFGQAPVVRRPLNDSAAALATLLAEAARVNLQIPDRLRSYRARIETEMSLVVLDSGGRERTIQLEQVASDVRWRAPDRDDSSPLRQTE